MSDQDAVPKAPVAFLSHASEDKATFVEPLGRELATSAVQPWLDKWEIVPGDSLVQKLFDEGLSRVDVVVVVVSTHSVNKPWVREELDNATVQRITRGTRLIPVRLDGVEMPAPLQHLVWLTAERTNEGIRQTAQTIADTAYGRDPRPAVSPPPTYANVMAIPGLTRHDTVLLAETIREAIDEVNPHPWLSWDAIRSRAEKTGLSAAAIAESQEALEQYGYIKLHYGAGDVVTHHELTDVGYSAGVRATIPDFEEMRRRIVALLVNDPPTEKDAIQDLAARSNAPVFVVDKLLDELERKGFIHVIRTFGGTVIPRINRTLTRELE